MTGFDNRARSALFLAMALAISAVAHAADPPQRYIWGDYERQMFLAYDQPDNVARQEKLEAELLAIIKQSDAVARKPPPGILAEYGYVLYRRGEHDAAIEYFEREAREWPDAETFMNRVIRLAQREGAGS